MKTRLVLTPAMFLVLLAFSSMAIAGVNVNIGVSLPPLVFSAPPVVAVIPGTDAYFCPDIAMDVYFYDGYWYRSYEGNWYRAVDYNGPWVYIAVAYVPSFFFHLPADYRAVGYQRIPYADLHRNWRAWQRDRYWEHHAWGRNDLGRGREMGRPEAAHQGIQRGESGGASMHREMGVAPRFDEHHVPVSGNTGHTTGHAAPMNKAPTQKAPTHQPGGASIHREMGVAPRFDEHHTPVSGNTGHTTGHAAPMNKAPTQKAPAHGDKQGR